MRGLKYFYRRRYRDFSSSIREFYRVLEAELLNLGLIKVGVQMGLGLTFRKPGGIAWGSVTASMNGRVLETLVSSNSRKVAILIMTLAFFLFVPYGVLVGLLMKPLQIITELEFVVLILAYAGVVIFLAYEYIIGLFPATRRLQRILMLACDRSAEKLGSLPLGKFTLVTKYPQLNRLSAWDRRIWKWRPWPDMITEEEFLKQS